MFPGWFMHCLLSLPMKLYSGSILAAYLRPGLFDSAGICFHRGIPPALLLLSKFPPSQTFLYHILSSVLFFSDRVTTSASKASPVLWTCSQTGIVCIHKCAWQSVAPPGLFVIAATEIWRLTGKRLMCRPLKIPLSILCMPCIWIACIARMETAAVNRITHRLHTHLVMRS